MLSDLNRVDFANVQVRERETPFSVLRSNFALLFHSLAVLSAGCPIGAGIMGVPV